MARALPALLLAVALLLVAASPSAIHARALDAATETATLSQAAGNSASQGHGEEDGRALGNSLPHGAGAGEEFDFDRLLQEAQRRRELGGYVRPDKQFTDRPVVGIVTLPITVPSQRKFGPSSFATSYARWIQAGGARVVPIFYDSTKEELDFLLPRYAARAPPVHPMLSNGARAEFLLPWHTACIPTVHPMLPRRKPERASCKAAPRVELSEALLSLE